MNPVSPMQVQAEVKSQGQGELRARKERALRLLLVGAMICFLAIVGNTGPWHPPAVVGSDGRFVLDANGRVLHKPTPGFHVMSALRPSNLGLAVGLGFMVVAGVVRFRRRLAAFR